MRPARTLALEDLHHGKATNVNTRPTFKLINEFRLTTWTHFMLDVEGMPIQKKEKRVLLLSGAQKEAGVLLEIN